jgi:hypothetical protein
VVLEIVRQRPDRHALRARFVQKQKAIFRHFDVERRTLILPVRDQFDLAREKRIRY